MEREPASGGSIALAELIDEHGPALVADFQAHYGLRLADVLFEWSPREVFALVEGLAAYDSGMLAAYREGGEEWPKFLGWGTDRHMFASWLDVYVQAHTEKGKKAWSYPRPQQKPPDVGGSSLMARFMGVPQRQGGA